MSVPNPTTLTAKNTDAKYTSGSDGVFWVDGDTLLPYTSIQINETKASGWTWTDIYIDTAASSAAHLVVHATPWETMGGGTDGDESKDHPFLPGDVLIVVSNDDGASTTNPHTQITYY